MYIRNHDMILSGCNFMVKIIKKLDTFYGNWGKGFERKGC